MLSHFSRVRLCVTPIDGSPPGFPVPGILQARTLEWVAISFSNAWKWKEKVKSLSRVQLLATPWTAAYQAPPSMGFSRQEYWSGVPLPSPWGCLKRAFSFRVPSSKLLVCPKPYFIRKIKIQREVSSFLLSFIQHVFLEYSIRRCPGCWRHNMNETQAPVSQEINRPLMIRIRKYVLP